MLFATKNLGAANGAPSFGVSACQAGIAGDCTAAVGTFCPGQTLNPDNTNANAKGVGDYLTISNLQVAPGNAAAAFPRFNQICGGVLSGDPTATVPGTICSFTNPFRVGVHFDSDEIFGAQTGAAGGTFDSTENEVDANGMAGLGHNGFYLAYWQNTC